MISSKLSHLLRTSFILTKTKDSQRLKKETQQTSIIENVRFEHFGVFYVFHCRDFQNPQSSMMFFPISSAMNTYTESILKWESEINKLYPPCVRNNVTMHTVSTGLYCLISSINFTALIYISIKWIHVKFISYIDIAHLSVTISATLKYLNVSISLADKWHNSFIQYMEIYAIYILCI